MSETGTVASPSGGIRQLWHEQRPKIVWGTILAACSIGLVVGAWFVYDLLVAPPVPHLSSASPGEVAEYLTDRRGWRRMSIPERKQWLVDMVTAYQDEGRRQALTSAIRRMPESDRRVFVDGFFEVAKPEVIADARAFAKTPPNQRDQFLRSKMGSYENLSAALTDFATPFGAGLPDDSPGWTKMLVEKTSPSERAIAKPYIDGLSELARSLRGGERSRRSSNASLSGGPSRTARRHN